MPVLPSGKTITVDLPISMGIRLAVFGVPAPPKGFFWKNKNPSASEYGTLHNETRPEDLYSLCPLPKNIEEVKKLLTITLTNESGLMVFDNSPLVEFPASEFLDEKDLQIWNKWLGSDPVQLAFEMFIDRCYDQPNELISFQEDAENEDESSYLKVFEYTERTKNLDYLKVLLSMKVEEPSILTTWVDLCHEKFRQLKAWKEAENFYRKLFEQYPENDSFRYQIFCFLLEQKRYDEIEREVWDEVAIHPEKTRYWELLADVYFQQGKKEEAKKIICLSISRHPDNESLQYRLKGSGDIPDWLLDD